MNIGWLMVAAVTLTMVPALARSDSRKSDPQAVALARQVIEALGGDEAWNETRFLRFDFAVDREGKNLSSRAHTWDKWTGRYRLEGKNKDGKPFVVLMNLNTKEGAAYADGARLSGDAERKQLESAYGAWVNDTYWLLMPYKLQDPGVSLASAGETKSEDGAWHKLLLTFDSVGLTPKDKYWVYVNRQTRLVDRWDFILKGEAGPPTTFEWTGWTRKGAVMLAPERRNPKDGTRIYFPVLEAPARIDDRVFQAP